MQTDLFACALDKRKYGQDQSLSRIDLKPRLRTHAGSFPSHCICGRWNQWVRVLPVTRRGPFTYLALPAPAASTRTDGSRDAMLEGITGGVESVGRARRRRARGGDHGGRVLEGRDLHGERWLRCVARKGNS